MPDNDDTGSRLRAVEDKQHEHASTLVELTTIRRTLGGLTVAVVLSMGGGAVTVIQALTRLDMLERAVHEHEALPSHRGTVDTLATLRGDLREIAGELRAVTAATTETRSELRALAARMDAAVPPRR